jgi:hypothetical protein
MIIGYNSANTQSTLYHINLWNDSWGTNLKEVQNHMGQLSKLIKSVIWKGNLKVKDFIYYIELHMSHILKLEIGHSKGTGYEHKPTEQAGTSTSEHSVTHESYVD